jgi:hypothetical protein
MCNVFIVFFVAMCNAHNDIIDVTLVRLPLVKLKTP